MKIDNGVAVLVVDMQNDFCSNEGALARLGADVARNQEVAELLPGFLRAARKQGAQVIWVLQGAKDQYVSNARRIRAREMGRGATEVAQAGTWGAELFEGLSVDPVDVVIEKSKYSAFVGTPLLNLLRAHDISELVVCGTAANVCVDSTVRDAYMADFPVSVPVDLVGYTRQTLAESALENLGFYFCEITDSSKLLN